jgi:hypothetical protein
LLALIGGAWSQVPRDGSKQHENAQGQQKPADPSKPVVAIESPAGANNQDHASEKPAKYPWGELLAPANVPNWFLVVVGGVTGWFVYKTLRAIKKQADIMETQANDARESGAEATRIALATAQAARKAADAAEKSATAAMGVAVPTLMLSDFKFALNPGYLMAQFLQSPRVVIEVKNYGQSPAILKSFAVESTSGSVPPIADYPPPENFDVGTVVETGKSFILDQKGITSMETFSTEDVRAIMSGDKYLTVYGCVWYGDVFGPTIHRLRFCKGLGGFNGEDCGVYWADLPNPEHPEGYDPN